MQVLMSKSCKQMSDLHDSFVQSAEHESFANPFGIRLFVSHRRYSRIGAGIESSAVRGGVGAVFTGSVERLLANSSGWVSSLKPAGFKTLTIAHRYLEPRCRL